MDVAGSLLYGAVSEPVCVCVCVCVCVLGLRGLSLIGWLMCVMWAACV